jgi:hypothetical protein
MTLPLFNDQLDDTPVEKAEIGFLGVNRTTKASLLPDGVLARARNIRIGVDGMVTTRPGSRLVFQAAQLPIDTAKTVRTQGIGYYDSGDVERIVIARQGKLIEAYSAGSLVTPTELAATIHGQNDVIFEQLITKLFWTDGQTLHFGTNSGASWAFGSVATMQSGASAVPLPAFATIKAHRFRLLGVPANSDYIYPSAIGQADHDGVGGDWDELTAIRVGDGNGDPITALVSSQSTNLTVLKQASCWEVDTSNVSSAAWTIRKLTDLTGCVAGKTAVQLGQDILFLSRYGVVSLQGLERLDSISQVNTLSAPIQPLIDRINWQAITTAHATKWRDMYLLFVPLDQATQPNVCLPYNITTRQWLDEWKWDLSGLVLDQVDTTMVIDENADYLVDELGSILVDHTDIVGAFDGVTAACITRFSGKEETIIGDSLGRVYRLDDTCLFDEESATDSTDIQSFVISRAWDFDFPRLRKLPFTLETEFIDSSSRDMSVLLVRDGRKTFPEVALENSEPVAEGFSASNYPTIPITIPLVLESTSLLRRDWCVRDFRPMRECQVQLVSQNGQMGLRSIRMSAFIDTAEIIA